MTTQLTAVERQRILAAHGNVVGDKMWVTKPFEMQNICAEIGLQPCLEEIDAALAKSGGRIDHARTLSFVRAQKIHFMRPDATDADTVRAFVAVGGATDKSGSVDTAVLQEACRNFDLTVDVDGLLPKDLRDGGQSPKDEDEESIQKGIEYDAFEELLSPSADGGAAAFIEPEGPAESEDAAEASSEVPKLPPLPKRQLELGIDYRKLLEREKQERNRFGFFSNQIVDDKSTNKPMRRPTRVQDKRVSVMADPPSPKAGMGQPTKSQYGRTDTGADRTVRRSSSFGGGRKARKDGGWDEARLRAKGVPPALYGGALDEAGDHAQLLKHKKRNKRKHLKRQPAFSSPANILGEGTVQCGRRGLLVDEQLKLPRHYPQLAIAQTAALVLSPRTQVKAGVRLPPLNGAAPVQGSQSPDAAAASKRLQGITKRMGNRRLKISGRYENVASRVNVTGNPSLLYAPPAGLPPVTSPLGPKSPPAALVPGSQLGPAQSSSDLRVASEAITKLSPTPHETPTRDTAMI